MNDKVILSHSGKQHSYHVARSLHELGLLERFYTSSYITQRWLQELILRRNNQYWSRRFESGLSGKYVEANWRFELREILYSKLFGQSSKTIHAVYDRDMAFDRFMARRMNQLSGSIFWGFQGSCHDSLIAAKAAGKKTICELSTAHAPAAIKILGEEKALLPEWADSFDNLEFPDRYCERLCKEPELADFVIGASRFTLETLRQSGIGESRMRYLPLGFDASSVPYSPRSIKKTKPLRLLYAGRITQRKGIHYLLESMKELQREGVELHIIGHLQGKGDGLKAFDNLYTRHSPVSQSELFKRYSEYDALVLPSVFEGFGLVIVEALAAGLPVITTPHTMGPELIVDDHNGYLVPVRDSRAITQAVLRLSQKSIEQREQMSRNARASALNYSWNAYTQRLKHLMDTL